MDSDVVFTRAPIDAVRQMQIRVCRVGASAAIGFTLQQRCRSSGLLQWRCRVCCHPILSLSIQDPSRDCYPWACASKEDGMERAGMRVEVNNGSARRGRGSLGRFDDSQRVSRIVGRSETSGVVGLGRMSWWVFRSRRYGERCSGEALSRVSRRERTTTCRHTGMEAH